MRFHSHSFEDLAGRFETPDSRSRWDAPLFTLRPASDSQEHYEEVLAEVAAVMAGTTGAPGSAAGTAASTGQALQPTVATNNPGMLGTNVLHEIDQAAQVSVAGGAGVRMHVEASGAACERALRHLAMVQTSPPIHHAPPGSD